MSLIDRFLNAIKLNDDFDDDEDFLDDEEDLDELDEQTDKKTRRRFFSRFSADDDDDEDEDDDDLSSSRNRSSDRKRSNSTSARKSSTARTVGYSSHNTSAKSREERRERESAAEQRRKQQKVTPIRKKSSLSNMEVNVIRPSSMEDTRDIADTLMENCTVVLNLEGLDVDIAQRVIDFTCGVCYSLRGNLQKVSSYIFILTPENVELSGDFQSILSGAFDLAPMRSGF